VNRALSVGLCAALLAGVLAGCSKKTTAPGPTGRVSGRVTYPGNLSAAGVDVAVISYGTASTTITIAVTDTAGNYAASGLAPAHYVVSSRDVAARAAADTVVVANGATAAANLVLLPGCTITGTVTLAGRADHRGTVVDVPVLVSLSVTDSTGAFELTGIPAGQWSVEASHAGYVTGVSFAQVAAPGDSVAIAPFQLILPAPGPQSARARAR
jgi:hypothetical protein